ncbi:phosphatidylinositol-specific phospholipase C domain-containing protein [Streptomyces lonarensis]|uniref:Phosphoinositide phospholipase C, Ca2+-dependent n=1 Tax=Streptomyces lonarensis TaxID=700599 RepID=A0A7X6D3R9_9ACTN|nr:phosphatidylinositol-specific phospholipase C domain-containing protein [Streptomyces lonarensis]NJQ07657.1 hypothetical protein [Streptomyces lonarensis]
MRNSARTRTVLTGTTLAALAAVLVPSPTQAAAAADVTGPLPHPSVTTVGVHNAYEKSTFPYLADALDSGAGLVELDVWTNFFGGTWRVAHDNPLGNNNNCADAAAASQLRGGARDHGLAGCLRDLRAWHDANPGHRPIHLKFEMKDGFAANLGRGPAQFDTLVRQILGDAVYRPGELLGAHPTLDAAARAGAWPTRDDLAGRFLIHLIPGTFEQRNPFDTLWTDVEYARHLRDLAAAGRADQATAFPAVLGAEAGDPRTGRYQDASLRPWFVVFDGAASSYTGPSIDTGWYAANNYVLVMTAAHSVAPAIDNRTPTAAQALDRAALLAGHHATVLTSDWATLPEVLRTTLPRG